MEVPEASDFLEITKRFVLDKWTIIYAGIFLLLSIIYTSSSAKRQKLPPGPVNLPILGYYPFLRQDPLKALNELAKKYGNIVGFYLGSQYVVVLNDWPTATEVLNKALDRPLVLFKDAPYNVGMAGINGAEWANARRMSSKAMKDIGMHRTRWEELVQEDMNLAVQQILKHGSGPLDARSFFTDAIATNILTFILGQKPPAGSDMAHIVMRSVDALVENSTSLRLTNFDRTLARIMEFLGFEKGIKIEKELREIVEIISEIVEKKINDPINENDDSFIDQINHDIDQRSKQVKLEKNFKEYTIKGNTLALLTGGSETSRTSLVWLLIAVADHPEIQRKVHEELDRVIGNNDTITWAQRNEIPYTLATILEAQRWKTVAPHSLLRQASEDIYYQGYVIPKGTYVATNIHAMHNDPKYWKEPEKFMPERFLSKDGKEVITSPDSYMPFSYGKRNCPGMLIGNMAILQNFTILMQKFRVMPKEGKKMKYDGILVATYQAFNAELCFIPR